MHAKCVAMAALLWAAPSPLKPPGGGFLPSPTGFRGGQPPLKTPFLGVRRYSAALESGNLSPHSKRKPSEKVMFDDKISKFCQLSRFANYLLGAIRATFRSFCLWRREDRGLPDPCPPLNPLGEGRNGERSEPKWGEGEMALLQHLLVSRPPRVREDVAHYKHRKHHAARNPGHFQPPLHLTSRLPEEISQQH